MNELKPVTREDIERLNMCTGIFQRPPHDRLEHDYDIARALWENGGWTAVPFGSSIMLVRIQFGQVNFYAKGRAGDYTTERKAGNTYESPLAALEHIVGGK